MRIPNSEHEAHAWRIDEVAPDFRLEDVWALPAQGRAEDFTTLLEVMASLDPAKGASCATRVLFAVRYRVGGWLGWDEVRTPLAIPDASDKTLSARLPADLRDSARGVELHAKDFVPLYRTDLEWAAEISNRTVHAVLQLAWVEQGDGLYRGQMGVYVKPRGRLGDAYMAAIAPFRHLVVYPALMREIERGWRARMAAS
jgi:hypothetical protein